MSAPRRLPSPTRGCTAFHFPTARRHAAHLHPVCEAFEFTLCPTELLVLGVNSTAAKLPADFTNPDGIAEQPGCPLMFRSCKRRSIGLSIRCVASSRRSAAVRDTN